MKKIVKQIRHSMRKVGSLLVPAGLPVLAGLLGAQPVFRPVPVRVERGHHIYRK